MFLYSSVLPSTNPMNLFCHYPQNVTTYGNCQKIYTLSLFYLNFNECPHGYDPSLFLFFNSHAVNVSMLLKRCLYLTTLPSSCMSLERHFSSTMIDFLDNNQPLSSIPENKYSNTTTANILMVV